MTPPTTAVRAPANHASLAVHAAPSEVAHDGHAQAPRRWLIGPLPRHGATPQIRESSRVLRSLAHIDSAGDDADSLSSISEERLWRFIQHSRGHEGDWERDLTPGLRDELVAKLKNSPWSGLSKTKRPTQHNWIGDTFQIGTDLLGASIIIEPKPPSNLPSSRPRLSTRVVSAGSTSAGAPSSYFTAETDPDHGQQTDSASAPPRLFVSSTAERPISGISSNADSNTRLLPAQRPATVHTPGTLRSAFRRAIPYVNSEGSNRRHVEFVQHENGQPLRDGTQPAHPFEVLSRTASTGELGQTSAEAVINARRDSSSVMRDRMIVRMWYNPSASLPVPYDENEARRHPDNEEKAWGEFVVTWNGRSIELHEAYSVPGKEWFFGHKHLAHSIFLDKKTTRLSVFSYNDMSFCLTCPPEPPGKGRRFYRSNVGTNIFVFKCRARSRAVDWIWQLWRQLGGELPPTIDVQVPVLGTRVTLDIPEYDALDGGEGFKSLTPETIYKYCSEHLHQLPEYRSLIEGQMERGSELALAWSRQMNLDWIWLTEDVNGTPRDWAVLFGLALKQGHTPIQLELRVASHNQTKTRLADGSVLVEPPGIEGFLYRIKPNSQARSNVYVSSHEGNLFTMSSSHAFPPPVPRAPVPTASTPAIHLNGDATSTRASSHRSRDSKRKGSVSETLYTRTDETHRGAEQILHASGYMDMRDIVDIKPAQEAVAPRSHATPAPTLSVLHAAGTGHGGSTSHTGVDEDDGLGDGGSDAGGDEPMAGHADKGSALKMERSFELFMRDGAVVRFEAHSRKNAIEWIRRLRALVFFWTRRHRVDARAEMDLVHQTTGTSRFERPQYRGADNQLRQHHAPPIPPDPQAAAQSIGQFWSWCTLDVCRPLLKGGRLYSKKKRTGHFKHVYVALIPGHLSLFHLTRTATAHHHRSKSINLVDACVYSGILALAHTVPSTSEPVARRYQDGLETSDSDLDTLFVVRYHAHAAGWEKPDEDAPPHPLPKMASSTTVPELASKPSLLIMRARTKLERDAWCWALNAEIERLVRGSKDREHRIRHA